MAFTINTNITSLQAQKYLNQTSAFQSKTINRVTSGLRIVNSGDDAAGLAIANSYRSDQAVLTQGVSNANDGLATLQTIDGGISNISKLLDRARTLAAQSASGTFTGSRSVLNSEFQSVLSEVDRQAQSIGMNTGGEFAKTLSVFVGGGRSASGATSGSESVANGSVEVNLSNSTVDTLSLGLKGFAASSAVTGGLQTSSSTNVQDILADTNNTTAAADTTVFSITGAGFSGADKINLSVNTNGVSTTAGLATAINAAITSAAGGGTAAAAAFAKLNLSASVTTSSTGLEQLTFTSSDGAFQVKAGDKMANALLGNFSGGTTGNTVATTVTGAATGAGPFAANTAVKVRFEGGGLDSAVTLSLNLGGDTTAVAVSALSDAVANNAQLKAAGITMGSITSFAAGDTLSFTSSTGEKFSVAAVGDTTNTLGLGTWDLTSTGANDYTSISGIAAPTAGATTMKIKVGDNVVSVGFTATTSATTTAAAFNSAVALLSDSDRGILQSAGIVATDTTNFTLKSTNNTQFLAAETGAAHLGFDSGSGTAVAAITYGAGPAAATATNVSSIESGGAYQATSSGDTNGEFYSFNKIAYGTGDQTVSVTAVDSTGNKTSLAVVLQNDTTANTGRSVDEAVATINKALQASNDASLQKIVAVKDNDGAGAEGIRFMSSLPSFEVSIGTTSGAQGIVNESGAQGVTYASDQIGDGANVDISTQAGAKAAVTALANAVTALGESQAVVGKGQNVFNYAVSLASTQLTNLAASESSIRDADLASEAANLTKAQILVQAGVAALAQANSAPQAVLSLLKG
jgi:flagellin